MKGIIVVDIPENCISCNMLTDECECLAMDISSVDVDAAKEKPDWCPIKQMTEKMEKIRKSNCIGDVRKNWYSAGWNDCIETILKGASNEEKEKAFESRRV